MEEKDTNNGFSLEQLAGKIQSLEDRLTKIESVISSGYDPDYSQAEYDDQEESERDAGESYVETNIGKYGLGWIANIVFIFAIVFVMSFVNSKGYTILSYVVGFGGVLGMFIFSHFIRKSFSFISYLIKICALLLLFYIVGSLHFFSETPLITSTVFATFLLILVAGGQFYFAIKRNSEGLAIIGIVMLLTTAILSSATHLMLPIVSLVAATAVFLFIRYEWGRILIWTIFLGYFTHVLWLLNNPFMGNTLELVSEHQNSLYYLFFYGAAFSLPMILRHWKKSGTGLFLSMMIINALCFSGTLLIAISSFYPKNYVWIFSIIAVACLLYSVGLKVKSNLRYGPAFYAVFGFIALSVAIYGYYDLPNSYLLLALQSFLVVSMAVWYRSTVIVVVNTLLFVFLLLFYMYTTDAMDSINFSFAFVGLATARILNWKKERLTLKTELFRNIYLIASFVIVLYTLYHVVPSEYVTLTWVGAAIVYFVFSFVLKNVKYRWMSIGTLIVTAFYLFFVDLKNMAMEYRVIAFLFLAVISLAASMYYAKRLSKKQQGN